LTRFNKETVKLRSTPMDTSKKLQKQENNICTDKEKTLYASWVGALMWAALCTRFDMAFAVAKLARYSSNPDDTHFEALDWLFGYIRKTISHELMYEASGDQGECKLSAYSDAAFADDLDTMRSTGAFIIFLNDCPIAWRSKLQDNVTRSTVEAEYVQLSTTAVELVSYRRLHRGTAIVTIKDAGDREMSSFLYGDNQGSLAVATRQGGASKTRHIAMHQHYVREAIENGDIRLSYVPTKEMLADLLTKALGKSEHQRLCALIGLRETQHRE